LPSHHSKLSLIFVHKFIILHGKMAKFQIVETVNFSFQRIK
jgi:hypothetical protein